MKHIKGFWKKVCIESVIGIIALLLNIVLMDLVGLPTVFMQIVSYLLGLLGGRRVMLRAIDWEEEKLEAERRRERAIAYLERLQEMMKPIVIPEELKPYYSPPHQLIK